MNRYICIHGHFYQPPRENPWLNEVEIQDSAHPFHDWNERITEECYARNSASRILGAEDAIVDIVNNYARMSFNFGPTLLEWMQKKSPDTYQALLDADKESQSRFSGHGSALAQVYNHMIMPLANERDKHTQVLWGMYDFRKRFGRDPEGMWLGETAADYATLEVLAEHGIRFTILSPYQAKSFRMIGEKDWQDGTGAKINPRRPYSCKLPSGKTITLFFYDAPVSQGIAFEGLLSSGEKFADRLVEAFDEEDTEQQLVHIATDGETYGHHHRFGEMALSYALNHIQTEELANTTIYGEFLERFPPAYEAEIVENTSWSCVHGIERWRSNCGCNTGTHPTWNQEWRGPLRAAFDWLRDQLIPIYEQEMNKLNIDPWITRNNYIQVIMDRSEENVDNFLRTYTKHELSKEEKIRVLKLLEMQYHTMLMYTSCGWFFDEVTGIETMQDILYAARAQQLARDVTGHDYETEFVNMLENAKSNVKEYGNAANAYKSVVKPTMLDLLRVGAHYAVSSLFSNYPKELDLYSYKATTLQYKLQEAGRQKLAVGSAFIKSKITLEEVTISFAVLHLGDHQLFGGVREVMSDDTFEKIQQELSEAFNKGSVSEVIMLLDKHFEAHNYSFWHLFKDDQRKILDQVLGQTMQGVENDFQQVYDNNYPLMAAMNSLGISLPRPLQLTVEYIVNAKLQRVLSALELNMEELKRLHAEIDRMKIKADLETLNFTATQRVDSMMKEVEQQPEDIEKMKQLTELIKVLDESPLDPDYWMVQNIAFKMKQTVYEEYKAQTGSLNSQAVAWCEEFDKLYNSLNLKA
ncbi:DUF3536 domain-containing protein [Pontibacter vulgaris]|uniref:DUF3536 domain-containing protein n=1 Tax=Pontibacter vulgaris TaxID=2905679 RepID=UPI001FA7F4A5|nr:DUF3536 domain-containing protein [Pontibacter vulgaris]